MLAAFAPSPEPFVALMFAGFVIGTAGHLYKSKLTIATGIAIILVATLLMPLALYLSQR